MGHSFAGNLLRQVPSEGNNHSRRHFPCIPSRKAVVAAMWDLIRGSLPCAAGLLLIGCAAVQPITQPSGSPAAAYQQHLASLANIKQFKLQGRIGVQTEGKGFSGTTHWQHDDAGDNIALFSPLGGQIATIKTTTDGVELVTSDGKSYSAKDAETLTQQNLGWSLPMQGLTDWVLGRPASGSNASDMIWDSTGRLTKLKQDGWEIEFPEYTEVNGQQLPGKINLRNPKLYLKLIVEQWEIPLSEQTGQI
ncbi:MAG TPA: lipoprotein insertase outer membrane protein LolB [Methylophilaceae bacterium]|nr:lipoprotein insertase outer membrane protein LolB [Methylophilaceae bacterium]